MLLNDQDHHGATPGLASGVRVDATTDLHKAPILDATAPEPGLMPSTPRHERRRRNRIRKADLNAVIAALKNTGNAISHIEVDAINGNFKVFAGSQASASQGALENWKKSRESKSKGN